MEAQATYNKNKTGALIVTLIFHAGLILILMYTFLTTPDPPMTGGEGMVVNLGYVDESTGNIQPMSENTMTNPVVENSSSKIQQEENKVITQELEETEDINVKENNTSEVKEVANPNTTEKKETEIQKTVDQKALYKGKNNGSTSQGTSDKGTGDQGDPNGDPNSKNYGKNTGTGNSPGEGNGTGSGPSSDLSGRKSLRLPAPPSPCQEEGLVVVEITVDKKGNVVKAKPGVKGSRTADSCLMEIAKQAAMNAKFSANPDAPEEQMGTITYNFRLK